MRIWTPDVINSYKLGWTFEFKFVGMLPVLLCDPHMPLTQKNLGMPKMIRYKRPLPGSSEVLKGTPHKSVENKM